MAVWQQIARKYSTYCSFVHRVPHIVRERCGTPRATGLRRTLDGFGAYYVAPARDRIYVWIDRGSYREYTVLLSLVHFVS